MQDVEVMVPRAAKTADSPAEFANVPGSYPIAQSVAGLARQLLSELSDEVWPRSSADSPDSRLSRAVAISTTSINTWTRSYQPNTWTHMNI